MAREQHENHPSQVQLFLKEMEQEYQMAREQHENGATQGEQDPAAEKAVSASGPGHLQPNPVYSETILTALRDLAQQRQAYDAMAYELLKEYSGVQQRLGIDGTGGEIAHMVSSYQLRA